MITATGSINKDKKYKLRSLRYHRGLFCTAKMIPLHLKYDYCFFAIFEA